MSFDERQKALLKAARVAAREGIGESITVEAWGCDVWVRALSAEDADRWEARTYERATAKPGKDGKVPGIDLAGLRAELLIACVYDIEDRTRALFSAKNKKLLNEQPATVVTPICELACRLSGIPEGFSAGLLKRRPKEPQGDAAIETALGNSGGDRSGSPS